MPTDADHELREISERLSSEIIGISDFIFSHPETGNEERESSAYLAGILVRHGFRVEYPYCGMPTAFRAECGNGKGAKIAFLAEYDALPGYGRQKLPAHACGHNWIAASAVGAALALSGVAKKFDGSVVVMGTPAEETTGGKVDLIRAHAFDDIDAAFQLHPNARTNLNVYALAIDAWRFDFAGKASHAAKSPQDGVNALDAVNLTFAGIAALRQQVTPDVRIHGIVRDGGDAPNVIPAHASCEFYVRALDRGYLDEVSDRVKNCARGAALMTGAALSVSKFENSFDDLKINRTLSSLMRAKLEGAGIDGFREEAELAGSTDTGNVSRVVPTFYGDVGVGDGSARIHEESFLAVANSPGAHEALMKTVKAFACAGYELLTDSSLMERVSDEFGK